MTKHKPITADELKRELRQFTGDLDRFRHNINRRVLYTPGVQHLAERAGAYWLIDVIASWIGSHSFNQAIAQDNRIERLHYWTLEVSDDRGVVQAILEDEEPPYAMKPFITQKIPFTDFLLSEISVWASFDGNYWTLYLPSEH